MTAKRGCGGDGEETEVGRRVALVLFTYVINDGETLDREKVKVRTGCIWYTKRRALAS